MSLTAVGNTLYFRANDGINGDELWMSDGTSIGTVMVKDIYLGSSNGVSNTPFIAVGNTLYFQADDGTSGYELWKSDGTNTGTVMVKDIYSGSNNQTMRPISSEGYYPQNAVGNTLYFIANDGIHGEELWKTDGTTSGTVMVKDINSGSDGTLLSRFIVVGNILYFVADDGTEVELWITDGTTSGTVLA